MSTIRFQTVKDEILLYVALYEFKRSIAFQTVKDEILLESFGKKNDSKKISNR